MATLRMCSIGDIVVDRYVDHDLWFPGGSAANVAVHSRRLGANAGFIGVFGSDAAGAFVRDALIGESVDVSQARFEDGPNAFTDVFLDPDGNRHFGLHSKPFTAVELDSRDEEYLQGCDWLHTGHSSATEGLLETFANIAPVAFDFSHSSFEYARPLLRHIRIAVFSRPGLSDLECREFVQSVGELGPSITVVTRGILPTIAWNGAIAVQAVSEANVVDTLGAGDAFMAAFAVNVFSETPLERGLQLAAQYAAQACTHLGAFGHGQEARDGVLQPTRGDANLSVSLPGTHSSTTPTTGDRK